MGTSAEPCRTRTLRGLQGHGRAHLGRGRPEKGSPKCAALLRGTAQGREWPGPTAKIRPHLPTGEPDQLPPRSPWDRATRHSTTRPACPCNLCPRARPAPPPSALSLSLSRGSKLPELSRLCFPCLKPFALGAPGVWHAEARRPKHHHHHHHRREASPDSRGAWCSPPSLSWRPGSHGHSMALPSNPLGCTGVGLRAWHPHEWVQQEKGHPIPPRPAPGGASACTFCLPSGFSSQSDSPRALRAPSRG